MKKTILFLTLFMTMFVEAVAQNDAMFVYRNDGVINAFLKTDIDSIRHSNLDVDSVLHKEYVVQEVWTVDSVYRIPLAAIDSVSFVTPPPSYQEGVEQVSADLYGYVISYTDSTITFKPNIPSHLLPTEGQVIVADKYEEPFTTGFSGRMIGMKEYADSIVCMFDGVYLDDIYSRLLLVGSAESYNDEINQSRAQTRAIWEGYDRKINLPASIPLKAGLVTAELERPSLKIDYLVCINEGSLQNHVMFKARFNSAGSLSLKVSKDSTFVGDEPHWLSSIPIKVGVVSGSIEFGYFAQFSGSIEAGVTFPFEVGYSGGFLYTDSKGIVSDIPQRSFTWKEPEWKASINGSLYAGVASRLSIALLHTKVACIDLTGKFGPEVSSSYTIDAAEGIQTTLYDNLKDVEVTSSLKLELTPGYRVWFNERKEFGGINLSVEFLKKTVPLMPSISNLSWKRLSNKSGELNGNLENDIFLPCKLGWAIYSNDEYHSTHFLPDSYWVQNSWNNNGLQYQLSDIPSTGSCKAYPIVRFLDKLNIRVPKYVDLNSIPVHITRFDVTDSEYKQGAFINDGLYYDYKFNVSLTVEIDDLDGVEDWGYVYRDPYGNVKRISLMEFGQSYTDTRYSYYRNEAHSTACLYTYVKYEGDSEYYDGEPQDFELHYDEPSPITERAENIKHTAADIICTFRNVPADSECGILVSWNYGEWTKTFPVTIENSKEETKSIQITGLEPGHYYNYHAYISTKDGAYYEGEDKQFRTTSDPPILTTGGVWEITSSSAKVSCGFKNVTEGMICGVQISWNYGESNRYFQCESKEGTHTITLTGLPSETVFWYRAYATDETGFYMDSNHGEFTTY